MHGHRVACLVGLERDRTQRLHRERGDDRREAQERALRTARKAKQLIDDLEEKRVAAMNGLATAVASLEKAGLNMRATEMILDGAEMRVRADLAWLENIERRLIRQK